MNEKLKGDYGFDMDAPAPVANQTLTAAPDLVERLSESSWNASAPDMWRFVPDYRKDVHRAHVRAVLSELAAMGREALPTRQAVFDAITGHFALDSQVRDVCDLYAHVAPALAAKDATIAEQARALAHLHRAADDAEDALTKERDAALAEVERLKAEAEAMRKRVRILEIAPKAAWWANDKLGCGVLITDADNAARVIAGVGANATDDWAKAVLEYAAKEGLT